MMVVIGGYFRPHTRGKTDQIKEDRFLNEPDE